MASNTTFFFKGCRVCSGPLINDQGGLDDEFHCLMCGRIYYTFEPVSRKKVLVSIEGRKPHYRFSRISKRM